jgi:hypothetical protein
MNYRKVYYSQGGRATIRLEGPHSGATLTLSRIERLSLPREKALPTLAKGRVVRQAVKA